ncbi:MAG: nascent polypeptide-associated complex protein [Methanophagales archaeon]|nr:nascent polypeptide-associated complex protein [Methanophagales archaeon]
MRGGFRKGAGLDPKRLSQQMKKMGISLEEISDVEEVVIRTADAEIVFEDAIVTIMDASGSKMYQVTGTPVKRPRIGSDREPVLNIAQEDIEIVMDKTGCSETKAKAALLETNGDLAEAIFRLSE